MKKHLLASSVLLLLTIMSFSALDFFSSMTKVDYVEGSKMLKFTTKVNTAHIAETIKTDPNAASFEAEVKKYIDSHFDVSINGAPKALAFTGSQVNGESVWVYFETGDVSGINNLKIKNTILLEVYPKQFNLVNIAYKGQQKTMNFQRGKEVNEVSF